MWRAFLSSLLSVVAPAAIAQVDPLDVLFVVEDNGASITVLDGERLEPVRRFATLRPVSGPLQFTSDARFVFFASGDGWIVKYDLRTFSAVAEFRAAGEAPRFAVSQDGSHVAVASESPRGLAILDADLRPRKVLSSSSRVSGVLDAARRRSFVVALQDLPELWEVSYDPKAEPIAEGVVHDFRLKEGTFVEGFLNPRRTKLEQPLDDVIFLADGSLVVGMQRDGRRGLAVQLDVRRPIAAFEQTGSLRPAAGALWSRDGKRLVAMPNARQPSVTILDLADWKVARQIATRGPGSFVRSHTSSRYAWTDAMTGQGPSDTLQIIDKETLGVAATLTPAPGKPLTPVGFDRSGRHALAGLAEPNGALLVFDARTLQELKRIPMRQPVASYYADHGTDGAHERPTVDQLLLRHHVRQPMPDRE